MNFRTTYILFAVLFAFLGVMLLSQLFGTHSKEQQEFALPSVHDITKPVKADEIETVEIQRFRPTKETLRFYKDSTGVWRCKEPDVRLMSGLVRQVIDQVLGAKKDEQADLTTDLKKFGLDSPAAKITLIKAGGEREWWLDIGEQSPGGSGSMVYATSSDDPKTPIALRKSDIDSVFKALTDFRAKDLLADNTFDISEVKVQSTAKPAVDLEKMSAGKWRFKQPAFGDAETEAENPTAPTPPTNPGRIAAINDLLSAVTALRVDTDADFDTAGAKDAELAQKGLTKDKPELMRIEVKKEGARGFSEEPKAATTDALLIGKKADDKGEKLYARLESDSNIVKIPATKIAGLLKLAEDPSSLRNRDLVQADSSRVDAIDVQPAGREMLEFRKSGATPQWKLYESGKPQDVDMVAVQGLLQSLTTKRLVKDFPEATKTDVDLGFDKPTAVVSLWTDGVKKEEKPADEAKEGDASKKDEAKKDSEKPDEKKDAAKDAKKPASQQPALKDPKPTIKLTFGKRDKDLVFVKREEGADVARMAVPGSVLDRVSEGKLAYFDHRLPIQTYPNDAIKVVLSRDGTTYEMTRTHADKEMTPWKLSLPKDLAGRTVENVKIQRILATFARLVAVKLIADKLTENDLERFGLKNPAIKLAISTEKDKKIDEHVYLLGKETDDKEGFYAKSADRDLVYVLPKSMVDSLKGDLQDPVVLQFDPPKVKTLKLTGWQDVVGSPITLQLERKSASEWVVKAPPDYKLDPALAESFLVSLNGLRAVSFLGAKSGPKPDQKFDLKDGGLDIVLTLEGEPQPTTLQIGGKTAEGWFTQCSKLPGDVFITPLDRFEKIKSKPAYFKKD
ncbi:MAG TPA: DUF4340 domain-containing protein [Gemmataceae bacterium]|nr:DUF4340 domain-containing protein [Gemmataceae bacterium]